ncbi:MAG TPA: YdeI/OmpD-associated family protein [Thermoanaerobaculia bacterium]|nr:YdeI/OmpD-associated family protein [Thermoanaerobaculia bacterium]
MAPDRDVTFFATPADFRRWLEKHHDTAAELLVGFYKVASGRPSITWPQSVDEALCFGWIDGVRKRIDDESYTIRFTPRRKGSIWSAINIRRVNELIAEGRMQPSGLRAFEQRSTDRSAIYSYENRPAELPAEEEATFRKNKKAWRFFSEQAPSYRRVAIYWVMSAKRSETRARRLATLIEDSANGQRLAQYTYSGTKRR